MNFKIIPILGRKTSVPPDDPTLFRQLDQNTFLTHDTGGVNFDLARKKQACSKSYGSVQWSNSANAQATKTMGLFELYDGTNRDHIIFDNGLCYIYDSSLDPQPMADAGSTTFANSNEDLYSIIKVGAYMVFTDRGGHTPYKWANGDANLTKLIASGTEYKFRWLVNFQRRVIGIYSDQANGDIDIRWSTAWPTTAIGSLNFPATNQLYVPNDDSLVGGATMGSDRCFLYSEDSIQQLIYMPDYETPFRCYTVVPKQGCTGHHSIVNLGDRHFLFNRNYGFCEYRGGTVFPYGVPISADIETELQNINPDYYNLIIGTYIPLSREVVWSVPFSGDSFCDTLLFYNVDTKQWRTEDKSMRYIDSWRMYASYTWNDLIAELGGTGAIWSDAGSNTWAYYASQRQRLVYSNTDGHLHYRASEGLNGEAIDGYRVEPIMDFGDPISKKLLSEIWFGIGYSGNFSIDVYHRAGNTVGELVLEDWDSIGSISCNSPDPPVIYTSKNNRYHQIKWGTNLADEKFEVNWIDFKYELQGGY